MEGIVVAVDESSRAQAALRWAVRHAALVGQPVTAVMAWGYVDRHHLDPDASLNPDYDACLAAKVLDGLLVRACGAASRVAAVAVNDLPARPSRGRAVLGSVSDGVSHRASAPVVVVP